MYFTLLNLCILNMFSVLKLCSYHVTFFSEISRVRFKPRWFEEENSNHVHSISMAVVLILYKLNTGHTLSLFVDILC